MNEAQKHCLDADEILKSSRLSREQKMEAMHDLIEKVLTGRIEEPPEEQTEEWHWQGMYEPKVNERYFLVGEKEKMNRPRNTDAEMADFHRSHMLCSKTEAEAEFVREHMEARRDIIDRLKLLNEGWQPDWSDYEQRKYFPRWDYEKCEISIAYALCVQILPDWFHAETVEICMQVIEEFGEEKVRLALWPKFEEKE